MSERYGKPTEDSAAGRAITTSINLLSVIFAQVYFPCYSNGLKEIARFLGFEWTDTLSSGLQSIAWRYEWEESRDPAIREKLIAYNADDCSALRIVAQSIARLTGSGSGESPSELGAIRVESLRKNSPSKWHTFKSPVSDLDQINAAAHWNYQRDRVFVRSGLEKRRTIRRSKTMSGHKAAQQTIVLKAPASCPECGTEWRKRGRVRSITVQDLVFGRYSVKRRIVKYLVQSHCCRGCRYDFDLHEWYLRGHARKWGWNVLSYFIYHVVGLRVPQRTMQHTLHRLFGFDLVHSTLNNLKIKAADYYSVTRQRILNRIIHGGLIHADETQANIKGHLAYVWVLTNLREVVYILAESREGEFVQDLLKDFKGVLVSDFYAAYDAIECPQQKCLIHFTCVI